MRFRPPVVLVVASFALLFTLSCNWIKDQTPSLVSCVEGLASGARPIATRRADRFQGKVEEVTARCRGGSNAVKYRNTPWTDWTNYWATRGEDSKSFWKTQSMRGINGSLIDLEYARVELIRFNLFDNSGTISDYINGRNGAEGAALKQWKEMRLPSSHPSYAAVGGDKEWQQCKGELIRFRNLTGICNDTDNPLMGSVGTTFARNVEFESTFPDRGLNELARNRHGGRISLLSPDPQLVSRKLFTRAQSDSASCNFGYGKPDFSNTANCDYTKAPFMNVLAAFWIQFMTHDWFSHLTEGANTSQYMTVGCTNAEAIKLGCRTDDRMERAMVADSAAPRTFVNNGKTYMARAPKTFANTNTAWWDASQIYGFDTRSRQRVKRDAKDPAKLAMTPMLGATTAGELQGYLPTLLPTDPQQPDWRGQESVGFPDNMNAGISFFHNVFSREHNQFVDVFRKQAAAHPNDDSGLRNPSAPNTKITYSQVTPDELFELARLVVSAEIAKIHTIEWTTQLLYDESLYRGMNSNWSGLLKKGDNISQLLTGVVDRLRKSNSSVASNQWYAILASGPGITGSGNRMNTDNPSAWSIANDADVNGGTNHFGSPFNFPEEFVTVYRLHALVPDLLEYRDYQKPDAIAQKIPVVQTFRGLSTNMVHDRGLANWALTMGRQRLAALALQNSPLFLQNLRIDRLQTTNKLLDVTALDIIRDRERGVPRFNEFRRQYGLRQLTSFDDFIDVHPNVSASDNATQKKLVVSLREVYGQHKCDDSKVITASQRDVNGKPITDCLGHPNGTMVDNVEDLDTVVGWLAESTRPHGFAISETQFFVFILNASRRLYSDRFLTSSFRPEIYSTLGYNWVTDNGPSKMIETLASNGHVGDPVSPMKRVLLRTVPELKPELDHVVNAFDPWARDRGTYYTLEWKPRKGAENDDAFRKR